MSINGSLFLYLGDQPGADVCPLISVSAKARVERLIQSGIDEGATVSLTIYSILSKRVKKRCRHMPLYQKLSVSLLCVCVCGGGGLCKFHMNGQLFVIINSCFFQCILDGRDVQVPGYEKGNFVGPTILANVTVSMKSFWFSCPMQRHFIGL